MYRLLIYFASRPWTTIVVLFLLSALAASQVAFVRVQISAEELLVRGDTEREYFDRVRERFGDEQIVLVYLEGENLLDAAKLGVLRDVIDRLDEQTFTKRVDSLFTVPYLRTVDGYLIKDPYLAELPKGPQEGRELLQAALENPFLNHVLLAPDGSGMALAVVLADAPQARDDRVVTSTVNWLIEPLRDHYKKVVAIGFPQVRAAIAAGIEREQLRLVPWAMVALLFILFFMLRQLVDIVIPVMTALLSILWTLGLMGLSGIPLNVVTSIVPILLIIVGSTEDIHLISEFRRGFRRSHDIDKALKRMAKRIGATILLTFLTTYVGFLSVSLSGIEALWQFGIVASSGLLFNFIITVSLVPATLALVGRWQIDGRQSPVKDSFNSWAADYWRLLYRARRFVIYAVILSSGIAVVGIPSIEVRHNPVDSLGRDSEVRRDVELIGDKLSGIESFTVVMDSGIQDTFLKVRYLDELAKVQRYLAEQGDVGSTTSFVDYLAMLNSAFQELEKPRIPVSDEIVTELMIFLEHEQVQAYVTPDYSAARILVRHRISSTRQLEQVLGGLRQFMAREVDPGLDVRITGDSVLGLSATRAMIVGQLQSILLLLVFFILIISVLFTDLRVGVIAAIPNTLPVLVLFGVMGYAGIPLNIGTTMAAAIAIGLAVDDTLHFMLRYNQELKSTKSQSIAMHYTIDDEAQPILATSLALIAGFLVFSLSDFEPVAQFGMMSALVIGVALIADFVVTPLVLASLRLVTLWDLLSSRYRTEVIPHSPLFANMRPWQIRRFVLSSSVQYFVAGDKVFSVGDPSDELFLVMHGKVEVRALSPAPARPDITLDEFGPGDVFGEVALLAGEPRRVDAVVVETASLLVLNREAIHNGMVLHPFVSSRLFLNLATDVSTRWTRLIGRLNRAQAAQTAGTDKKEDSQ